MSLFLMSVVVLSACFSTIYGTNSNEPVPHWENLECEVNETNPVSCQTFVTLLFRFTQVGHKYLFSTTWQTWHDAKLECELYGGFLLNLKDISEQNCLLRYYQSQDLRGGKYWTDGKSYIIYI